MNTIINPKLYKQLKSIKTETIAFHHGNKFYYPCSIELDDGTLFDCVYLFLNEINSFWWINKSEENKLDIDHIKNIMNSNYRLPAKYSKKFIGETGMGYTSFVIIFKDGTKQDYICQETCEFPDLPTNYSISDISNVIIHNNNKNSKTFLKSKAYYWCLFTSN
jgi:hypothetical protein